VGSDSCGSTRTPARSSGGSPGARTTATGILGKDASITGSDSFADQHYAHAIDADVLMLFDNRGDAAGSRVLEISLDTPTSTATIDKSWAVVNAAATRSPAASKGSGEQLPDSDHVLAMCAELRIIAELDDPTGASGGSPPLVISLPSGNNATPSAKWAGRTIGR
jgi:hypothetical protein